MTDPTAPPPPSPDPGTPQPAFPAPAPLTFPVGRPRPAPLRAARPPARPRAGSPAASPRLAAPGHWPNPYQAVGAPPGGPVTRPAAGRRSPGSPVPPAGTPGQPYPYGAYPPPGYGPYPLRLVQRRTNGMAIGAMVTSMAGVVMLCFYGVPALILGPLGAILGHVARRKIRESGEEGDGMAADRHHRRLDRHGARRSSSSRASWRDLFSGSGRATSQPGPSDGSASRSRMLDVWQHSLKPWPRYANCCWPRT